ncbi:MAG: class I SAM-dependent methyltransferase [Clostridiales bacterium]|nr:class I SAM-dependent methyltransferase [Eubacteriales bacterium]MDH7566195.1 class I SAM-dependent methyltransferase [Clostridiales bacterium]
MDHREFFNSMAEKWDSICRHDPDKIGEILDLADIRKGDRVLDVGTGTGILIPFLVSRVGIAGQVTAVDFAEKMIEMAKRKHDYANVKFVAGDVFNLDMPMGYFDVIMCYSVFPHFGSKLEAVEKLGGFAKPGGKLVICHSQSRDEINQMHKNASETVSRDYLPDGGTLRGYFSSAGLSTVAEVDDERLFVVIGQKKRA